MIRLADVKVDLSDSDDPESVVVQAINLEDPERGRSVIKVEEQRFSSMSM